MSRWSTACLLAIAAAWSAVAAVPAAHAELKLTGGRYTTCFWHYGAFGVNDVNIAYPDAGATYWAAGFYRPRGSRLLLRGDFPHSRYFSLTSYDGLGQAIDGIADYQIDPDAGSVNPFRVGASRVAANRSYTVEVVDGENPGFTLNHRAAEPARNLLYGKPTSSAVSPAKAGNDPNAVLTAENQPLLAIRQTRITADGPQDLELILVRVYVPDRGVDERGGVALPEPELLLADGTTLRGQALCDATGSQSDLLPEPSALLLNLGIYKALRYPDRLSRPCDVLPSILVALTAPGCSEAFASPSALVQVPHRVSPEFPATDPVQWRAQFDRRYLLQLYTGDDAPGAWGGPSGVTVGAGGGMLSTGGSRTPLAPPRQGGGGFFPNLDNSYVRTALSRKFGKVVVVRGVLPTFPGTHAGQRVMGSGEVRYTSFCMNESVYTTKVMHCTYDERVPTDSRGRYVIVVSRRADRPKLANRAHGVAWIEWSPSGDGYQDPDFGWLQIRNMLPLPTFSQSVQDTVAPGDEQAVMGRFLPTVGYLPDATAFDRHMRRRMQRSPTAPLRRR